MKKFFAVFVFVFSLLVVSSSLVVHTVKAVCPVCTVAVIAGLGVSRALGIDDIVSSIWIGGLILSISFWLIDWVKKKKWLSKVMDKRAKFLINFSTVILMYLLVLIPLRLNHSIGILRNRLWGIDKIVLGALIGSVAFLAGMWADRKIREIKGKQLFNFQKVVFPVLALVITSLFFYFITKLKA